MFCVIIPPKWLELVDLYLAFTKIGAKQSSLVCVKLTGSAVEGAVIGYSGGVAFVVPWLELARKLKIYTAKNRDSEPFLPNSWNPVNGITLGRVSTDVLAVILWRFDRSAGIYRAWRCKPKSPALPRSKADPVKSETQTARSVCWSFIQFRYKIVVSWLNEIFHLSYSLGCLWTVWKVEEKLECAKTIEEKTTKGFS